MEDADIFKLTRRELLAQAMLLPAFAQDYKPTFFSSDDFQALDAFTDILIPADETPGARDAQCAKYIDFVLQSSSEMPRIQENWRKAMTQLRATGFYTADTVRRFEIVTEMSRPETDSAAAHPAFSAYLLIKQQTAFAFFTSKQGMIRTLDYKGNSYNITFPPCNHPEHQTI